MNRFLIMLINFICCVDTAWAMQETKALFDPFMYQANCQMQVRWANAILESVDLKSATQILDIGSGDGHITSKIALASPHANIIGLDISQEMVDFANRNYGGPKLFFITGDAHKLPFHEQFDAVVSFSAIHRFSNPKLALSGIFNALKLGGKFIAAFPASGSPVMSIAIAAIDSKPEWKEYFTDPDRKNYALTDEGIKQWLTEIGFFVIKSQTKWEDEVFASRDNFRDLLRATFSHRAFLPPDKELQFFEEIVDEYLKNSPLDQKGQVHFYFNRVEIVAIKVPRAKL